MVFFHLDLDFLDTDDLVVLVEKSSLEQKKKEELITWLAEVPPNQKYAIEDNELEVKQFTQLMRLKQGAHKLFVQKLSKLLRLFSNVCDSYLSVSLFIA